jgi:hypothetical protein
MLDDSDEPGASQTLSPNDHLKMLIELLRPLGPELARRWMAALTLAPEDERPAIVDAVERRMVELYRSGEGRSPADDDQAGEAGASRLLHVKGEPVQREGYVEETETTYEVTEGRPRPKKSKSGEESRKRRRSG